MSEAQEQPGHQLEWGYEIPTLVAERIKQNAPIIGGLDVAKVLRGHVLQLILGDDSGVFGTAVLWFDAKIMKPEEAIAHKEIFMNRVRWELEQDETPQRIKAMLIPYQKKLTETNWETEAKVRESRAVWEETVHSKVAGMVKANEDGSKDARDEYERYEDEVRKRKLNR